MTWITWKRQGTDLAWPLTIEQKIELFYEQIWGWQLHIADQIANGYPLVSEATIPPIPHSGFAVLQICLSYFETIGKYRPLNPTGSKNGTQFKTGTQAVFPELQNIEPEARDKLLDALYVGARCGLYHNSRTCRGVGLGQPPNGEAIVYDSDEQVLQISPERLPKVLKHHLERYRTELLDPTNTEVRDRFANQFDEDFGAN